MSSFAEFARHLDALPASVEPLATADVRAPLEAALAHALGADECSIVLFDDATAPSASTAFAPTLLTAVGSSANDVPRFAIQAACSRDDLQFDERDARLLELAACCIKKAIEAAGLRAMLHSRFAQLALMTQRDCNVVHDRPNQVARLLARTFYREMTRAGFECNQIIGAATEIISELSESLRRRRQPPRPDNVNRRKVE